MTKPANDQNVSVRLPLSTTKKGSPARHRARRVTAAQNGVNLSLRIPVATNPCQHGSLIVYAELLVNRMDLCVGVMDEFLSYGLVNPCLGSDRNPRCPQTLVLLRRVATSPVLILAATAITFIMVARSPNIIPTVQGANCVARGVAPDLLFLLALLVGIKEKGYEGRCRSDSKICVSQLKSLRSAFWTVPGSIKIAEFCNALNDNNKTT
jgi:hypothetical protein